jgi:hypothetical protein
MYDPPEKAIELAKTATLKKDKSDLNFNELFHVTVKDPEEEIILVKFVYGNKMRKPKEKDFIGEVSFALRGRSTSTFLFYFCPCSSSFLFLAPFLDDQPYSTRDPIFRFSAFR